MCDPTDEALAAEAQRGDRAALEQLLRRYEKRLYNYVRRMVGHDEDALDLVQDTFVRVCKYLPRYNASRPFRPWIYRIATNRSRDHLRARARRRSLPLDASMQDEDGSGATLGDRIAGARPNPHQKAVAHEQAELLEKAVAALPEKLRAVFLMARYEDMRYDEIAKALRIPTGTVKSRMNKAVTRLRETLREDTQ